MDPSIARRMTGRPITVFRPLPAAIPAPMQLSMLFAAAVAASVATTPATDAMSLQSAYDSAPAQGGYDRYLVLETGAVYTGGLQIGPTWDNDHQQYLDHELGLDVKIEGRGAILDLQGQQICISFCRRRLDIEDCIIINGGIRYRGDLTLEDDIRPLGSVRHCTFWRPHDYAVRLEGTGDRILLERNIVVDAVDTGFDVMLWNGEMGPLLPTGLAFGLSIQFWTSGVPDVLRNWTYFTDPAQNESDLYHYCLLCEYS
jgi:hypothetical protein